MKARILKALLAVSLLANATFVAVGIAYTIHIGGIAGVEAKVASALHAAPNALYDVRTSVYSSIVIPSGGEVFIGDSLTENYPWRFAFPGAINMGIDSDNVAGVLARESEVYRLHPSKVFIMVGINDLIRNRPPSYILSTYTRILDNLRQNVPQASVYVESVLPFNPQKFQLTYGYLPSGLTNSKIATFDAALGRLAQSLGDHYLDLYPDFLVNGELPANLTPDGLHLYAAGYSVWLRALSSYAAPST